MIASKQCGSWPVDYFPAALAELGDKRNRPCWIVAGDEVANVLDIPLGLTAEAVLHQARRRFAI